MRRHDFRFSPLHRKASSGVFSPRFGFFGSLYGVFRRHFPAKTPAPRRVPVTKSNPISTSGRLPAPRIHLLHPCSSMPICVFKSNPLRPPPFERSTAALAKRTQPQFAVSSCFVCHSHPRASRCFHPSNLPESFTPPQLTTLCALSTTRGHSAVVRSRSAVIRFFRTTNRPPPKLSTRGMSQGIALLKTREEKKCPYTSQTLIACLNPSSGRRVGIHSCPTYPL